MGWCLRMRLRCYRRDPGGEAKIWLYLITAMFISVNPPWTLSACRALCCTSTRTVLRELTCLTSHFASRVSLGSSLELTWGRRIAHARPTVLETSWRLWTQLLFHMGKKSTRVSGVRCHAIAVVFTKVRELRVLKRTNGYERKFRQKGKYFSCESKWSNLRKS